MTQLFPAAAPDVLYIVDLSSYVLRAYHAIAPLSSPTGEPTHAVHGTVSMLERLVRQCRPALLAIAMDSGRVTFRKEIYDQYKANRPPAPTDLKQQLVRCEQIVRAFNIPIFKQDGVEADDLIASAVKSAGEHDLRVVIVAADKDLMPLVSERTIMWDTMRDRVFGVPEVEERFGVRIDQVQDLLALTGDTSDNIPGVPSVGPKTAKDLLVEFGSLSGIYQRIDEIKKKGLKDKLVENKEKAFLSQQLVKLKDDCPIVIDRAHLAYGGRDVPALKVLYAELGFQRQLQALSNEPEAASSANDGQASLPLPSSTTPSRPPASSKSAPAAPVGAPEISLILNKEELGALATELRRASRFSIAVETSTPSTLRSALVGIALAWQPGKAAYLPVGHRYMGCPKQLGLADVKEALGPLFADESVAKSALDLKRVDVILAHAGFRFTGYAFDATLAAYLLDPESRNDREPLVQRELGVVASSYESLTKKKRGQTLDFDELTIEEASQFVGASAVFSYHLQERLEPRLAEDGLDKLLREVELPLASLLARMEERGVLVDTEHLAALGRECEREIQRLEAEAHTIAGKPFNVNSPRQLETLLFDEIGLKPLRRTKTSRSTDADTLEALAELHALPKVILEIRQLSKLKGTYIDALPQLLNPTTGRIHTSWEQAVAATGRLSSTDPNLQNIPIRTELGRKIRQAFIPPPGHVLVSADYSQIELRVLAHLSQDPVLLDAFRTGQDIHTRTALEIFELREEELTREHRTRAKAVNFGVIYGQGDSGLSKSLGIARAEASSFIAAYFRRYEGVRRFMNETLERARAGEAVRSLLGRRRLLPTIRSANRAERLAAERIAMNMPIQGTAADLLKLAMLALKDPPTPGARMTLSVHDELVFEVPEAEVAEAEAKIKVAMENVYQLAVPLIVEVGHGPNWNDAH
ncbi:MAG TPA: DNA polymerase I [Polyangiaceae bacterium]|jgi:DNA polymerase-1|nr:DNA polymerase I [Polyangiaceae bacterium]